MVAITHELTTSIAHSPGYSETDINAGVVFYARKTRLTDPPGEFDKKGRFYAAERAQAGQNCRSPSAAYPYPEMKAARTAAHCAEVHGAKLLKRIARAVELERSVVPISAHETLAGR